MHIHRVPVWFFIVCSWVYKLRFPFPYISLYWYLQIEKLCKEAEIEFVSIYCPLLLFFLLSHVVYLLFVLWGEKCGELKLWNLVLTLSTIFLVTHGHLHTHRHFWDYSGTHILLIRCWARANIFLHRHYQISTYSNFRKRKKILKPLLFLGLRFLRMIEITCQLEFMYIIICEYILVYVCAWVHVCVCVHDATKRIHISMSCWITLILF